MVGRDLAAVVGVVLIVIAAWSVIGTLVVPRRVRSYLTRWVALGVATIFRAVADASKNYLVRDRILAARAPVQLVVQIAVWLATFEVGFGLLLWRFAPGVDLGTAFEQAGSALVTLGYLVPHPGTPAGLFDLAALAGLGTVALQIGYLPTLYAAFNRRETLVSMLDSRAGMPSWGPELLARTHFGLGSRVSAVPELPKLFERWETWSADVAESHATYPTLASFRSAGPYSSWLTAQLAMLDAAALYLVLLVDPPGAITARLCLRGGFTCLGTVARSMGFDIPAEADPDQGISLTYDDFVAAVDRLRDVDFPLTRPLEEAWPDFVGWRVNYERAAFAIAWYIDAPPALWSGPRRHESEQIAPFRPPLGRPNNG